MNGSKKFSKLTNAFPFWISLSLLPVVIFAAANGGWALLLPPLAAWGVFSLLDVLVGTDSANVDPETPENQLYWHRMITLIWFPIQFLLIFGMIWYMSTASHLSMVEKIALAFGIGSITGTIGINYSHELMHRSSKLERWLGDLLLGSVMYSHFRSEHLLVHHRYVGTPRDAVSARYNESFYKFFLRVLVQSFRSAWRAEKAMLARKNAPVLDATNPFWRYFALQGGFLLLAMIIGGWVGIALFLYQAFIAVWQLEMANYIEHYGLTRKHLGKGKYEHTMPRHSWNATHKVSNWLLINLQRHSDHHYNPSRRFPLLQHHKIGDAPQLPHGYTIMTLATMWPPLWFSIMNPRVRKWRAMYYPEITDWRKYKTAENPMPR